MPTIYRISQPGREPVVDVGSVEAIEGTIQAGGPGCFHIDEIAADPARTRPHRPLKRAASGPGRHGGGR